MIDEARLRKTAEKKIKARQEFYQHLAFYVLINPVLIGFWLTVSGGSGAPWALWVAGFWGVCLALHFFYMIGESRSDSSKALQLQKEMDAEREKLRQLGFAVAEGELGEKPKRHARISDDGELEYEEDSEQEPAEKPKIRLGK
jgi:hypothetical protein